MADPAERTAHVQIMGPDTPAPNPVAAAEALIETAAAAFKQLTAQRHVAVTEWPALEELADAHARQALALFAQAEAEAAELVAAFHSLNLAIDGTPRHLRNLVGPAEPNLLAGADRADLLLGVIGELQRWAVQHAVASRRRQKEAYEVHAREQEREAALEERREAVWAVLTERGDIAYDPYDLAFDPAGYAARVRELERTAVQQRLHTYLDQAHALGRTPLELWGSGGEYARLVELASLLADGGGRDYRAEELLTYCLERWLGLPSPRPASEQPTEPNPLS